MPPYTQNPRTERYETSEIAYRGATKRFEVGFFEDDERTTAIAPGDTSKYPRVVVYDADQEIYLTASPPQVRSSGTPGWWVFDFEVPTSATVTQPGRNWEFYIEMVNAAGRPEVYRTAFMVRDPAVIKNTNVDRFYAVVAGRGTRVMYRSVVEVSAISLSIGMAGFNDSTALVKYASVGTGPGDIKKVVGEDGIYVYYFDVPNQAIPGVSLRTLTEGTWHVYWDVREYANDATELMYQFIEVINAKALELVPHVRYVVDKLDKRKQSKQNVSDNDLIAGIRWGTAFVNSIFPTTTWTLPQVPESVNMYIILGAAYFVYLGQLGLAVDLQFNFSGQTTTLDQDQTGGIESMLSRYESMIREELKLSKTDLLRHMRPVAHTLTRPSRGRYMNNLVYRIGTLNTGTYVSFLNSLGLI